MSRLVMQMAKRSRQHGISMSILANNPGFSHTREETANGVTVYRVPWIGSTFITQLPSFGWYASRLLRKLVQSYDLIYSNYSPVFGKIEKPLVVGFRGTRLAEYKACLEIKKPLYAALNFLYLPFDKFMIKKANGIIALSKKMGQEINLMGGGKKHTEIIPNGVDTRLFRPLTLRKYTAFPKELLFVGRLDASKGIETLLLAFKEVSNKIDTRLTIVGAGREASKLVSLTKALRLPVTFLGQIPNQDMPDIYNQADLLVLPSFSEGMPSVVLEAMACATPVIASDASPDMGFPRFKRGRVDRLTQAIFEVLSSKDKSKKLSDQSLAASRNYSWDRIVDLTFNFFRKFN
jgi:glycosyltransferase involved in cell wall biosynthesis